MRKRPSSRSSLGTGKGDRLEPKAVPRRRVRFEPRDFEQIVAAYDIEKTECIQLLVRLDRLGFIQLQANNRIKLLVSHNFSWLPDGPIQRFFNQQAHNEYFRSRFARPHEHGRGERHAVPDSSAAIVSRLKRVAREFSELHNDDSKLPSPGARR